jgi:hypothetical protein
MVIICFTRNYGEQDHYKIPVEKSKTVVFGMAHLQANERCRIAPRVSPGDSPTLWPLSLQIIINFPKFPSKLSVQ